MIKYIKELLKSKMDSVCEEIKSDDCDKFTSIVCQSKWYAYENILMNILNTEQEKQKFPYKIIVQWSEENKTYVADVPEVLTCSVFGSSPEDAMEEAITATNLVLEVKKETKG
jgi:predicted RNase H-like HicB family nuclease